MAMTSELSLMQAARAQPHTKAVVGQHLQARRPEIREEVGVMRPGFAEHAYHARQCRVRSGAHVERFDGKPRGVDPNHLNSSRKQSAHAVAAVVGQAMLTAQAPRRSSMRMFSGAATTGAAETAIGTNSAS